MAAKNKKEIAKNKAIAQNREDFVRDAEIVANSLSGLAEQLNFGVGWSGFPDGPQISSADSLWLNNRWYMVSNMRQLLSQLYVEHGVIQTLIDQPVIDAFRVGFEVKSSQLSQDEIEQILAYCEKNQVIHNIIQAIQWARLYGGGGILIITNQDPAAPFRIQDIKPDDPLELRAVDMWELFYDSLNTSSTLLVGGKLGENLGSKYDYYGNDVHKSRVLKITGKEAPSFIRPRLRGWGMSEVERVVRSLNQYLKNQDLIFQLLDEAKVDVYRLKGFNASLIDTQATNQAVKRAQATNQMKSFNNAITMDKEDEYDQKQITFAGLAEILTQIRQGIAADLKMPMTKLFGISSAGFSSGEDDIENYNGMVEGEVRNKNRYVVIECLRIVSMKLFGIAPDDLTVTFNPLRILNAKEEEEVKDSQFARMQNAFTLGLATAEEATESINAEHLLPIEIEVKDEALPPMMDMAGEGEVAGLKVRPARGGEGADAPTKGKS